MPVLTYEQIRAGGKLEFVMGPTPPGWAKELAAGQRALMAATPTSKQVVYAALIGNLLVAATKTLAALWTGSSAMMSEAIHSFVDSGNEVLLLYGQHRAVTAPRSGASARDMAASCISGASSSPC